jgi:methyltransferase (TIGR00027 family)
MPSPKVLTPLSFWGAGYDTRAYRMPELVGISVCEVDLPGIIARKAVAVQRCFGRVPPGVRLLAADFETESLAGRLARDGFAPDKRIFYVWESVTLYLTGSAVRKTKADLAEAAPGSGPVSRSFARIFWTTRRCTTREVAIRRRW